MRLLSQIEIHRPGGVGAIQLLQGDLSSIPAEHATDILVISAYPGDYTPLEGSLIGALDRKGLSIKELATSKAVDLRTQLHCWLSQPLPAEKQQQLNVKKVLCFEAGDKLVNAEVVVGNIFRCINTFAFEQHNNVVALPVVATGHQRVPVEVILPAMIESAVFWLKNGLPLRCIKLVVYKAEYVSTAMEIFETITGKNNVERRELQEEQDHGLADINGGATGSEVEGQKGVYQPAKQVTRTATPPHISFDHGASADMPDPQVPQPSAPAPMVPTTIQPPGTDKYDYFISYAHTHADLVHSFVSQIKQKNSSLYIFYDRDSIPPGGQWIRQLSAAIQKARKVLIFLSPDYDKSMVCWDEFQCAKLMEYNRKQPIIQTIYLYDYKDIEMPPIMGIYSYIDCREGDTTKLNACIEKLLTSR